MPWNMEIKAKIAKPETLPDQLIRATNVCGYSGAEVIDQKDTFFGTVKDGILLKLREEQNRTKMEKKNLLVAYTRESKAGAKSNEYEITPVEDVPSMIKVLSMTNEKLGEVYKTRHVFLATRNGLNARVHLDSVKGLGDFLEFQVQMQDRFQEAFAKDFAAFLCHKFNVHEKDMVAGPYFELKKQLELEMEKAAAAKAAVEAEKAASEAAAAGKKKK